MNLTYIFYLYNKFYNLIEYKLLFMIKNILY